MSLKVQTPPQTLEGARAELSMRLEARREEIEAAVTTRVFAVSNPSDLDQTYAEGLKAAVAAAVDYGFAAIELGEERASPPPPILLAQARLAARAGVPLDTVLRRYFAGHALLSDFLIEEAEGGRLLRGAALQSLLRTQATLFDRLLAAVSEEYSREAHQRPTSSERRHAERIERLIVGELIDTSGVDFDFSAHHLGATAQGPEAAQILRGLATAINRRLLLVHRDGDAVWAWLGGRRAFEPEEFERMASISQNWPPSLSLALGEPAQDLPGWRLTHRQARATLPIAQRTQQPFVRYGDVALLSAALKDDLLATSLRNIYLRRGIL